MTWKAFLDFSTMEERHLVLSYAAVFLIQGGYLAWMVWNWRLLKKNRL